MPVPVFGFFVIWNLKMKKLIEVRKNTIGNNEVNAVSARELYLGLGFDKSNWSKWAALNIEQNEFFLQGVDYVQLVTITSASNPNPPKDYAISIDFAKHISLMAKTSKGHEYRNYFLELEKQPVMIKKLQEVAREYKGALALAKLVGYKDNQAHLAANKAVLKSTGYNVHAEMNLQLEAPKQSRLLTPTDIGLLIGLSNAKVNQLLKEKGYQSDRRNSKLQIVWIPTDKGNEFASLLDTGKKHGDGTPVQQLKWIESIIDELQTGEDK